MRSAIVVCIGLALALCGWLFFVQHDTPPPSTPMELPVAAAPGVAAAETAEPAAVDASATSAANERTSAPVAADQTQPPIPDDATWLEVLVVDKATKQPIAGADAWWTNETQWELVGKLPAAERDAAYRDADLMAERFGWRGRSDKDGKLRITLGKNGSRVMAREGQRFGEAHFASAETPPDGHRLLLGEDLSLRVRVLDHAGRIAPGVPVSLVNVEADGKPGPQYQGELSTGEDGIATFRHVQSRQLVAWGPSKGKPVAQWSVRVAIPRLDAAPVLVDAQAPPLEPIEIELPPTGRLHLLMTFEGKPVRSLEHLSIHCGPKDDHQALNSAWMQPLDADGVARFCYVPLGQTFFVGSYNGGEFWNFEVQGPRAADQEVSATLELSGEVIAFAGRLLDGDGSPIVEESVGTRFELDVQSGGANVRTDAAGRFLWIVARLRDGKRDAKLTQMTFEREIAGASPQRITVPPRDVAIGRNELGDLRFSVGALVVAGRFVFDTPGPSSTWFQVEKHTERPSRPSAAPAPPQWHSVGDLQIASRDDGTFEARGTVDAGRYRIRVHANNHLPVEPVEFVPGTRDLEIAVRRGTPLEARCRLPEGVAAQRILLDLQAPGAARPAGSATSPLAMFGRSSDSLRAQSHRGTEGDVAVYRWPALPPGTYSLRVAAGGFPEPLLAIADVVVPPPAGGDPRLMDLDLRPVIGTLRVRVQGPPAAPARRGSGMVFPQPQAEGTWFGFALPQDENVLPVPRRPVDLLLTREGCRPVTVRGAVDVVDVTMEPWPTLEVRFTGIDALPDGVLLRVAAVDPNQGPAQRTRYVADYSSGLIEQLLRPSGAAQTVKDGVATLRVGDGAFRLAVSVRIDQRGRIKPLKQVAPAEVFAGAPVTVQLSADEIRAAVEELRQPEKK